MLTTRAMIVQSPVSGWYAKWRPSALVIIVPEPAPPTVNVPLAYPAFPSTPTTPTSWSSHDTGSGCEVTVKRIALLSFMLGATVTNRDPVVAPFGIVIVIAVAGAAPEFTDTLSNTPVAVEDVVRLLTARPRYTLGAMVTV